MEFYHILFIVFIIGVTIFFVLKYKDQSNLNENFTVVDFGRENQKTPFDYRTREYESLGNMKNRPVIVDTNSPTATLKPVQSGCYPYPFTSKQENRQSSGPYRGVETKHLTTSQLESVPNNAILSKLMDNTGTGHISGSGYGPEICMDKTGKLPKQTFTDISKPDVEILTPEVLNTIKENQPYIYGDEPYVFSYYGKLYYRDWRYPREPIPVVYLYREINSQGQQSGDNTKMSKLCSGYGLENYPCYVRYSRMDIDPVSS